MTILQEFYRRADMVNATKLTADASVTISSAGGMRYCSYTFELGEPKKYTVVTEVGKPAPAHAGDWIVERGNCPAEFYSDATFRANFTPAS